MRSVGGKDAERLARRRGMHLTVEMWFADCADPDEAFVNWMKGINQTTKAAKPSWVHIKGHDVPEKFQAALEAAKSEYKPILRVVK